MKKVHLREPEVACNWLVAGMVFFLFIAFNSSIFHTVGVGDVLIAISQWIAVVPVGMYFYYSKFSTKAAYLLLVALIVAVSISLLVFFRVSIG